MSTMSESCMLKPQELVKIMECPVCMELPLPPIFCCIHGHIICSNCRPHLDKCPLCHAVYTNTRNLIAESIVEASNMKCYYSDYGCDKFVTGKDCKAHLQNCDFRPILCNDNRTVACHSSPIDHGNFFHHLINDHKAEGFENELDFYPKTSRCTDFDLDADGPYFYLKYDGRIFLQHTKLRSKIIYWWITLVGSEIDASNYKAIITVYNQAKKHLKDVMKFEYTIPVHSIRSPADEIIRSRHVASLSTESMLPFCVNDIVKDGKSYKYSWDMMFAIRKLNMTDG